MARSAASKDAGLAGFLWVPETYVTWADVPRNAVSSVKRSASARPEVG